VTQVRKPPATPRQAARRRAEIDGLLAADLFKALSDPTRLRLLACLAKCARGCLVSEIAQCCDVDLSVVSRHLATLADAGLLQVRKEGRSVIYAVDTPAFSTRLRDLADALDACAAAGAACCTSDTSGGSCCAPR
jgi:ArsR family transcriptional regulator